MVLQLEVVGQIVYLLTLIAVLIFARRKCKRNSGSAGQTIVHVNAAGDDDGDTNSGLVITNIYSVSKWSF